MIDTMKKLEDIPKKDLFDAPEGYFESFPMRMQKRLESEKPVARTIFYAQPLFKYAFAFLLIISIAVVLSRYAVNDIPNGEAWLAEIPSTDLIIYLEQSNFIFDDFLAEDNAELWGSIIEDDEFDVLEAIDEAQIEEYLDELQFEFQLN